MSLLQYLLHFVTTRRKSTVLFCLSITFLVILFSNLNPNQKHQKENKEKERHGLNKKICPEDLDERVSLFKMVMKDKLDGVKIEKDACFLQTKVNETAIQELAKRTSHLKEECNKLRKSFSSPNSFQPPSYRPEILFDNNHLLSFCRNAKAGTTFLMNYLLELNQIQEDSDVHDRIKELFPIPETRKISEYINSVVVRHPFKRLVSSYGNKMLATNYYKRKYPTLYEDAIKFDKMGEIEVVEHFQSSHYFYSLKKHIQCRDDRGKLLLPTSKTGQLSTNSYSELNAPNIDLGKKRATTQAMDETEESPSFRGFSIAVIESFLSCGGNSDCLNDLDVHYRTQFDRCLPCLMRYDNILKLETVEEDISLIESFLDLPPVLPCLQQLEKPSDKYSNCTNKGRSYNRSLKDHSYQYYMGQLNPFEVDLLYEMYWKDFTVFDYDPCDFL